jgi:hypothetical protein
VAWVVRFGSDSKEGLMKIPISITLKADERKQLAGILRCNVKQLEKVLVPYCEAAAEDYIRMFLGHKVFTRGSDMREYRLFLLIQRALGNRIPDEQRICDLFQTTVSQSRSLTRSVTSKYQYELSSAIDLTLKETIRQAKQRKDTKKGDDYQVTIHNEHIVDIINQLLASIDGTLPQMAKERGTVSTYALRPSSHAALAKHYNL